MRSTHMIHSSPPTTAASTSRSNNTPEGFSISADVVPEEAWEEIRLYLGLSTSPCRFDERHGEREIQPSIEIDGFSGDIGGLTKQEGCGLHTAIATTSSEIPWESTPFPQNRPVAQFGFRYDYEKDVVVPPTDDKDECENDDGGQPVPKIPAIFQRLLLRPYQGSIETKLRSVEFSQCIVNVYHPSTTVAVAGDSKYSKSEAASNNTTYSSSIPWHFDDPQFGPDILVFTFGETRSLHMRLKHDNKDTDNIVQKEAKESDIDDNFSYFTANPSHRSCYVLSGPARHKWQHSVPSGLSWRVSITFRTLCAQ